MAELTWASTSMRKGCARGAPDPGGPTKSQHLTSSSDSVVCPSAMAALLVSLRGLFLAYSVGSGGGPRSDGLPASAAAAATSGCVLGCLGGFGSLGSRFWRLLGGGACWLSPSQLVLQFSFSGWSEGEAVCCRPARVVLPLACSPAA